MPKVPKTKPLVRNYVGVDPGKSGGLVCLYQCVGTDTIEVEWATMPQTPREIWDWFNQLGTVGFAMLEWIHPSIQGIGKSSMSKLYGNYQMLEGFLVASLTPYETVKPPDWQRGLKIPKRKKSETTSQWKNRLRARAQELYPKLPLWSVPRTKGIQLAIADALLIATYCKRREEGTL